MQELKSVGCELPHSCRECPRGCGANRAAGERGLCGADERLMVARAALHFWEEPPISGEDGSGTVFFAGCPLRCVYCQNADIALGEHARAITVERLAAIMGELEGAGALNINCVTPTHYGPQIREAVALAREAGMGLPVLWNTGGYETVEAVRANRGLVDAYLTDFKYADAALARRYSRAADYPEVALAALAAMVEETGEPRYDEYRGQERLVGPGELEGGRAAVARAFRKCPATVPHESVHPRARPQRCRGERAGRIGSLDGSRASEHGV